jgi:hypothetical protein
MLSLPTDLEAEVVALMQQGRTIEAIQRLRLAMNVSLADAKRWVDDRVQALPGKAKVFTGRPCPFCGKPLRTDRARQCFECGKDWHE